MVRRRASAGYRHRASSRRGSRPPPVRSRQSTDSDARPRGPRRQSLSTDPISVHRSRPGETWRLGRHGHADAARRDARREVDRDDGAGPVQGRDLAEADRLRDHADQHRRRCGDREGRSAGRRRHRRGAGVSARAIEPRSPRRFAARRARWDARPPAAASLRRSARTRTGSARRRGPVGATTPRARLRDRAAARG